MVLGKLPVPGRRAYCACSRCGWGSFGHFYSALSFFLSSPCLWGTVRYRLKYCLKGPLSQKQTNKNKQTSTPNLLYQRNFAHVNQALISLLSKDRAQLLMRLGANSIKQHNAKFTINCIKRKQFIVLTN